MACYYPWEPKGAVVGRPFACGRCHGCKLERARQWGVRCVHEASLYEENTFITLTYKDAKWSLEYEHFQEFMKALRVMVPPVLRKIRYFVAGEYGEQNSRAHFHACLFNWRFPDQVYLRKSPSGYRLYRSAILESLWPHGFSSIGDVTYESAAYVAKYCMKVMKSEEDEGKTVILDPDTGEIFERRREFLKMSLKPSADGVPGGLGGAWIDRYLWDVYPSGKVVVNGVEQRAPRYYDKIFRRVRGAAEYMELCYERSKAAARSLAEMAPGRLEAREKVSKARLRKGSL